MLIAAPNIEKIECEGGLDEFLVKIFKMCREQKVPIIFSLSMGKLGLVAKSKGTKIALLAVIRCVGNEELFNVAVKSAEEKRKEFYDSNAPRIEELKASKFLLGSTYLAEQQQQQKLNETK